MKPEDVPEEYLDALISQLPYQVAAAIEEIDFRAAIAAVAPLIAAAERERMAQRAFDQMSDDPAPGGWNDACTHIAAAIRARIDAP